MRALPLIILHSLASKATAIDTGCCLAVNLILLVGSLTHTTVLLAGSIYLLTIHTVSALPLARLDISFGSIDEFTDTTINDRDSLLDWSHTSLPVLYLLVLVEVVCCLALATLICPSLALSLLMFVDV